MAEIPRLQSFRVGVNNVPGAATPSVSFGQQQDMGLGYKAAAQYQGRVGEVLDKISSTLFQEAGDMRKREGLEFAATNPLTREQLQAMARGDMSTVDMGSPQTAYGSMLRKARSIELSGHLEMEARQEFVDLIRMAERGEIGFADVERKVDARINAGGEVLAAVEPEASYKYRASMATLGGQVIDKVSGIEASKRRLANSVKLERDYSNMLQAIDFYATSSAPIDPLTGQEISMDEVVDALKQNFLNNAVAIGGINVAEGYQAKLDKDVRAAKVNAITKHIVTDEFFGKPGALQKLMTGDAGRATYAYSSLSEEDRRQVMTNYMTALTNRNTEMGAIKAQQDLENEKAGNDLLIEYYSPGTTPKRKLDIGFELAKMGVLSTDQMEKYLGGGGGASAYAVAELKTMVIYGRIDSPEQLRVEADRLNLNGQQYAGVLDDFFSKYFSPAKNEAKKKMQIAAGLPDIVGARTSSDNHKFKKRDKLFDTYNRLEREANAQGEFFDPMALADKAIEEYNKIEGANANKAKARKDIDNTLSAIRTAKQKANKPAPDFTVDEDTNLEDLLAKKWIDQMTYDALKKQQKILRGE